MPVPQILQGGSLARAVEPARPEHRQLTLDAYRADIFARSSAAPMDGRWRTWTRLARLAHAAALPPLVAAKKADKRDPREIPSFGMWMAARPQPLPQARRGQRRPLVQEVLPARDGTGWRSVCERIGGLTIRDLLCTIVSGRRLEDPCRYSPPEL